jgi:hypothetical protein
MSTEPDGSSISIDTNERPHVPAREGRPLPDAVCRFLLVGAAPTQAADIDALAPTFRGGAELWGSIWLGRETELRGFAARHGLTPLGHDQQFFAEAIAARIARRERRR